jgi:hypothetical protein
MARQFHVTVYAIVEGDKIVGWEICEPDATPNHPDEQIYNDTEDRWERSTWEEDAPIWLEVDSKVQEMLATLQ